MTPLGSETMDWPEAILYIFVLLVISKIIVKVIEMYLDHRRYMKVLEAPKCFTIKDIPDDVKDQIIELLDKHKDDQLDFDPLTGEYYKDRRR